MSLSRYLIESSTRCPDRVAVCQPWDGASITYGDLGTMAAGLRDWLAAAGVSRGDRVGVFLPKSIDAVACLHGVLQSGAAYVPIDPDGPITRNTFILADCSVRVVILDKRFESRFRDHLAKFNDPPIVVALDLDAGGLKRFLDENIASETPVCDSAANDLAYILYTSGSTGVPKGVMITHENATSFVDWCADTFAPTAEDRFSSHAPFHFDLSILDLYTSAKVGAALVLVSTDVGKEPIGLARLIAETKITIWYSAPSILSLMAQFGKLADYDYSALRFVLFAGEVFPVPHLRSLKQQLPHPRYFNLYGPTETNVCTSYEIPTAIADDRTDPYPVGKACEHLQAKVVDPSGAVVAAGEAGELCIAGLSVTPGYWNLTEQTRAAFLGNGASEDDRAWYRTGDLVVEQAGGDFVFRGRRDRMIKRRGFRIELGEIEACLHEHADVLEAAVVAATGDDESIKVIAHLATRDGERLSMIKLKSFCVQKLPAYMIPDVFEFHARLPRTSTDKVDYQSLQSPPAPSPQAASRTMPVQDATR